MAAGMGNSVPKSRGTKNVPQSLAVANSGVKTGSDFANLMSNLMSDLISGKVTPQVGNAVCNAGGKLLKIVEMKHKYGTAGEEKQPDLTLATGF